LQLSFHKHYVFFHVATLKNISSRYIRLHPFINKDLEELAESSIARSKTFSSGWEEKLPAAAGYAIISSKASPTFV